MIADKDFRVTRYAPRVPSLEDDQAWFRDFDTDVLIAGKADGLCGHCGTPALALNLEGEIVHFVHEATCPSETAQEQRRAREAALRRRQSSRLKVAA